MVMEAPLETPIVCHEVAVWQAVTRLSYGILAKQPRLMSSASRAARVSAIRRRVSVRSRPKVALYRMPVAAQSKADLAAKVRGLQPALRRGIERRDALLDIVRAVNTTLDPRRIADLIVDRAVTWIPAPCWAVVSWDLSGRLSVLAGRGLSPEIADA